MSDAEMRLQGALYGNFDQKSAQADAILRVIYSESRVVRRTALMTEVITNFSLPWEAPVVPPSPGELLHLSEERFSAFRAAHHDQVTNLVRSSETEKITERMLGVRILVFLDRIQDRAERAVAFALILWSPLVPYVRLPEEFSAHPRLNVAEVCRRPEVRRSLAMIHRVLHGSSDAGVPSLGVARVLARHQDPLEVALLFEYAAALYRGSIAAIALPFPFPGSVRPSSSARSGPDLPDPLLLFGGRSRRGVS